jgi:hypothetical protein
MSAGETSVFERRMKHTMRLSRGDITRVTTDVLAVVS